MYNISRVVQIMYSVLYNTEFIFWKRQVDLSIFRTDSSERNMCTYL